MPTLPASGYATPTHATVEPSATAATPYQDIRGASAEAFGAGTGEALSRLGGQFEQAAGRFANIQDFHDRVAIDDQLNQYETRVNKVLYGDPDTPGDVGFMGLKGKAAADARITTQAKVDQILKEHQGVLQNANQSIMFNRQARSHRNSTFNNIGRHYDSEMNRWNDEATSGRASVALSNAGIAANNDDFGGWQAAFGTGRASLQDGLARSGKAPEFIEAELKKFDEKAVTDWAQKLATRDPVKAEQFIDANREYLPTTYDNLKRQVRAQAGKELATSIATGAPIARGTPNLVRGGAVGDRVDQFLDMAEKYESGGKNIEQNIVPAGGGYNPSTGTVTGPSTASGHFQITNTTWREFAPQAGVNLSEYPRAIGAPYEVQRQVARTIATTSGVQHWTNFNPRLKQNAQAAGLPVSGPVTGGAAPPTAATPAAEPPADVLLTNLPEREPGQIPDNDLGQEYLKQLGEAAKRVPPGTPIGVWHEAVRQIRQKYNDAHTLQRRQEQATSAANKAIDEGLKTEYNRRIAKGEALTGEQILADPRWKDADAARSTVGFMERQTKRDPAAEVSKRNERLLFARMTGPEADEGHIFGEKPINDAYLNADIDQQAHKRLIDKLREEQDPARLRLQQRRKEFMESMLPKIFPYAAMVSPGDRSKAVSMDPAGAKRLYDAEWYIDEQIKAAGDANRNPINLFNPKSPEYLGNTLPSDVLAPVTDSLPRAGAGKTPLTREQVMSILGDANTSGNAKRESLSDAIQSGLITKKEATDIGFQYGLLRRPTAPVAAPVR